MNCRGNRAKSTGSFLLLEFYLKMGQQGCSILTPEGVNFSPSVVQGRFALTSEVVT